MYKLRSMACIMLDGVLYSMPLSDILTFLIAAYLIVKTYRSLEDSHT